ncbi:class I SAM-dependent methyltransferase [Halopiger goleimassiliensis]|uniref:class I SAM-dependent methyltransferase n=1 Tax=Halopiger goleimassiliensis TaxID=1293048 RepID=UPI000678322C|nr:class I SAM-dependent methyltransferase [Halopiger goleimassiliensis]
MGDDASQSDDPQAFYDAYGDREWDRLEGRIDGRLEFTRTVSVLEERLPPSGHVLDAGGGAGRYSIWLAEQGYDVTMLDLSRGQLDVARERIRERGLESSVTLLQGSITDLGLPANAVDATCCLGGPLSHVLEASDRDWAVRELRRVTAPGGPVLVSVMGLLGAIQLYLVTGHNLEALPELVADGDYDAGLLEPYGYDNEFTATHFFRREELRTLLERNGLTNVSTTGLEGLASVFHDERLRDRLHDVSDAEREAIERTVHLTSDEPAVADLSIHLLAAGEA